jgi:hypothetical protein
MVKVLGWIASVVLLAVATASAFIAAMDKGNADYLIGFAFLSLALLFLALGCNPLLRSRWLEPKLGRGKTNLFAFGGAASLLIAFLIMIQIGSMAPAGSDVTASAGQTGTDHAEDYSLHAGAAKATTEQEAAYDVCAKYARGEDLKLGEPPDASADPQAEPENEILVAGTRGTENALEAQCFSNYILEVSDDLWGSEGATDEAIAETMKECDSAGYQCHVFGTVKGGLRSWAEVEKKNVAAGLRNAHAPAVAQKIDPAAEQNYSDGGMATLEQP